MAPSMLAASASSASTPGGTGRPLNGRRLVCRSAMTACNSRSAGCARCDPASRTVASSSGRSGSGSSWNYRLAARHGGSKAHVEQRGTAGEVYGAAVRVAVPQCPLRVRMQLDGLRFAQHPESPGLGVVHGRRGHRSVEQVGDHLLRQLPRLGRSRGIAWVWLRHVASIAVLDARR